MHRLKGNILYNADFKNMELLPKTYLKSAGGGQFDPPPVSQMFSEKETKILT